MSIFNRQTIAAFLLGTTLTVGMGAFAVERHMGGHGPAMAAGDHMERMLKHLYVEVDATEAQKAKIDPLVKAAMDDLKPMHEQLFQIHKQVTSLLAAPTINRAELEKARASGIALADKASVRVVKLLADIGDSLTPAQRQKLAERLDKMHERRHHGG